LETELKEVGIRKSLKGKGKKKGGRKGGPGNDKKPVEDTVTASWLKKKAQDDKTGRTKGVWGNETQTKGVEKKKNSWK